MYYLVIDLALEYIRVKKYGIRYSSLPAVTTEGKSLPF